MNELQARQLVERIQRDAPHLSAEPVRHGYPGYDETWAVKISRSAGGVTSSMEIEDAHQWELLKASI